MQIIRLFIPVFLLIGFNACVQQVDPTADLPTISYQADIAPIIAANCAVTGCHNGGGGERGSLQTYDEVMRYCDVQAGKPHSSKLYTIIRSYVNGIAMPPKPNSPLTDEQIATIYVWILQGAKNN